MTIFWATQYRPENTADSIAVFDEIEEIFTNLGASKARLMIPITHDVGTVAVVTDWDSVGDAVAAFDPVDGTALAAIAANPKLAAVQAAAGPPVRRVVANVESEHGDKTAPYAVNVVQTSSAGPELWAETSDLAWSIMEANGTRGMRISRVITGEGTGQTMATVMTDDVNQFFQILTDMPPRLVELFRATDTTTQLRNVHRVIGG